MKSIHKKNEFSLRERGSKFYGFLVPCVSIKEFDNELCKLKEAFSDATHHCYAYRVHESRIIEFSSDDGEPSGSAGLPILNALRSANLVNCGAIVIRYYGGTKLGKSGLIEAYGQSIKGCIDKAKIKKIRKVVIINVKYNYHQEREIQALIRKFKLIENESEFSQNVKKILFCPFENEQSVIQSLEKLHYLGITFQKNGYSFIME